MRALLLLTLVFAGGCRGATEPLPDDQTQSAESASVEQGNEAAARADAEPPPASEPFEPAPVTVGQRSTTELPIPAMSIQLTIDDITRGQVMASVSLADGQILHAPISLRVGDVLPFAVDGHSYVLTLTQLDNELIGEDAAEFLLRDVSVAAEEPESRSRPQAMTEDQKIEWLIAMVAAQSGAVFVRNGREHSNSEAAGHLRRKWEAGKNQITTAEEFIEHVASRSSLTGEPYVIRFADRTEQPAGEYLREQLRNRESPPSK